MDSALREFVRQYELTHIVGQTPTGRATVGLLRMNEPERLRVRALLLELGRLN